MVEDCELLVLGVVGPGTPCLGLAIGGLRVGLAKRAVKRERLREEQKTQSLVKMQSAVQSNQICEIYRSKLVQKILTFCESIFSLQAKNEGLVFSTANPSFRHCRKMTPLK